MTIKQAIQKAVESGYEFEVNNGQPDGEWKMGTRNTGVMAFDTDGTGTWTEIEKIFLDRFFWQSLGNALGWSARPWVGDEGPEWRNGWLDKWVSLIDYLADGKTAEEFFATL